MALVERLAARDQLASIREVPHAIPVHACARLDDQRLFLADQTTGQNDFNEEDARWGVAFNGMSNEFMYNFSWVTGSGPTGDALDYNPTINPQALDLNVSYGGMMIPWSVGVVGMLGHSPVHDTQTNDFLFTNAFSREGLYLAYQDPAWHVQTMYFHGFDNQPDVGEFNVPLNGFFLEVERDLGWRNHIAVRYDVASSDTLNRQVIIDFSHNVLPNLALIGEAAGIRWHARHSRCAFNMPGRTKPECATCPICTLSRRIISVRSHLPRPSP